MILPFHTLRLCPMSRARQTFTRHPPVSSGADPTYIPHCIDITHRTDKECADAPRLPPCHPLKIHHTVSKRRRSQKKQKQKWYSRSQTKKCHNIIKTIKEGHAGSADEVEKMVKDVYPLANLSSFDRMPSEKRVEAPSSMTSRQCCNTANGCSMPICEPSRFVTQGTPSRLVIYRTMSA